MTIQFNPRSASAQRRNTLRFFYVFVVAAIVVFTLAADAHAATQQGVLMAVGIVLAAAGIWSFVRFLQAADTHQKLINHDATSFAFAASLVLTLVFGLLQRFGFLRGASLLLPALMIALWSIGLILFSWRYQE
jgi:FtsH-binding integral membrane protein